MKLFRVKWVEKSDKTKWYATNEEYFFSPLFNTCIEAIESMEWMLECTIETVKVDEY